jgi:hypothetical protein
MFPQAQAAQQPAQSEAGGLMAQMPAQGIEAPPIFYPQRKPVDLSKLKMAFRPPIFSRNS